MRTLILSDVYFPRVNGVSTSIQTVTSELRALGDEVVTIAPDYPGAGAEPGLIRIASHGVPFDPEDRRMRYAETVAAGERLGTAPIDLIHVQTPFIAHYAGLEIGHRLGVPVIATYHTVFEEYLHHYVPLVPRALVKAVARRFSRRQCNQLDAVIVPSTQVRDLLHGYGARGPIHVLPTGIPEDWFGGGDGAAFRVRHGIAPARPMLLFVGRVAYEKNIEFLLGVARRVLRTRPDALLVIAGEGPAHASLREAAQGLGIESSVRFVGNLDRASDLRDCFRAADLFVFASRTETQGLVLLEAMASGVPVVSIAELGSRDVLREGHGCLIAPLEEAGFTDRVLAVLGDQALRGRLAASAIEWAREWAAPRLALRLRGVYGSLHRASRGAPALTRDGADEGSSSLEGDDVGHRP
jgi:glycosyltransferase involved in cell wall biosynthesis